MPGFDRPIIARHFASGAWVRVHLEGGLIGSVEAVGGAPEPDPGDDWIAPAFWDLQLNGRWGRSFADLRLTIEEFGRIVQAQGPLGTARLCPTLFTASPRATAHALRLMAQACDSDPEIAAMIPGLHLEGPYIASEEGYRGAHPRSEARDPDWDEFRRWQDLSGGRIALVTLAPERPGAIPFVARAVRAGVRIALGHTTANAATLRAAVDAGATLSTHLGNGIAAQLPRHPNPIFEQAADDRLTASLIADGEHLDPSTLKVLLRAKTAKRVILVSDASPLAGLPPGPYGEWSIEDSGRIVVAGTPYLAGANQGLALGLSNVQVAGLTLPEAIATVTTNPARLLGRPAPELRAGQPACLVRFHREGPTGFRLRDTWVDGRRCVATNE